MNKINERIRKNDKPLEQILVYPNLACQGWACLNILRLGALEDLAVVAEIEADAAMFKLVAGVVILAFAFRTFAIKAEANDLLAGDGPELNG